MIARQANGVVNGYFWTCRRMGRSMAATPICELTYFRVMIDSSTEDNDRQCIVSVVGHRENGEQPFPEEATGLSVWRRVAFGFGHVYNDLCASMWFSYLLVFFKKVLLFSGPAAGHIFLIGQISDAIATPIVGFESDRTDNYQVCIRYGRRKSLHLIGTLLVFASFAFLFMRCFGCTYGTTRSTPEWVQLIYYAPFVVIFQLGWASVQIGHLALIPELSPYKDERATLNGIRYAFTVFASIVTFALVYLFVGQDAVHSDVTPHDAAGFSTVGFIVTGVGLAFSILFHLGIREVRPVNASIRDHFDNDSSTLDNESTVDRKAANVTWRHWLKNNQFYLISLFYMLIRLFNNVTMTYLPLYILETQNLNKMNIATVPLAVYISSFFTSTLFSFRYVTRVSGRKISSLLGIVIGVCASGWMWHHELGMQIYGVAILLGISAAILIINALALTADLINKSTESGAFVFGAMSFFDKMLTGVGVQIIQSVEPMCAGLTCEKRNLYFKYVMVCIPSASLLLALITLILLWPQKVGQPLPDMEPVERF
ncbi:transporter, major facilitator family protein [Trichuris suis]|nr:transporter, major facilitator family protein [Trichuris suis]